ncbi:MAG: hypothetical protein K0S11_1716 [Gammaproteobacteria bacterium]|jgi:hypothetical protein|nr:hypothetical protein [Gammaproteobacteria bacterium]
MSTDPTKIYLRGIRMVIIRNSDAICKIVQTGNIDQINQAIKSGSLDITEKFNLYNVTVWHLLAEGKSEKHYSALETLLKKYAYYLYQNAQVLNQKDTNGLTPILCAADVGNIRAIRLLVTFGADPAFEAKNDPNTFFPFNKCNAVNLLKLHKRHDLVPEMETIICQQEQLRATLDWHNLLLEQEQAEEREEQASLQKILVNRVKPPTSDKPQKGIYQQLKTLFSYCHAKKPSPADCIQEEYSLSKKLL